MSQAGEVFNSESQNVMSRLTAGMSATQRYKEGVFDIDARERQADTSEQENRAAEGEAGVGGGSGGAIAIGAIRSAVNTRIANAVKKRAIGKFKDLLQQRKNASSRSGQEDNGSTNDPPTNETPTETSEGGTQTDVSDTRPDIDLTDIDQETRQPLTETAETATGEGESGISDSFQSALDDATQEAGKGFEATPADDDEPLSELTDFTKEDTTTQDVGTDLGGDENLGSLLGDDALAQSGGYKRPPAFEDDEAPTAPEDPVTSSLTDDLPTEPAVPAEAPTPAVPTEAPTPTVPAEDPADAILPAETTTTDVGTGTDEALTLASQTRTGASSMGELQSLLSKQGMSGEDMTAMLKGFTGDTEDLLSAGTDLLGGLGGESTGLLATIGGGLLDTLGPLGAVGGLVAGIWSAVSSDDAVNTAKKNAADYQSDINYLSATPQLSTGSIAMPTMDTTSFRTGGLSNF